MNIAEIAKMAGVSRAAVSRYFNNGYISAQKREAIRKVVEETGYRPSMQAQTLRTKKSKMIGVIVPQVASASIGKILDGLISALDENGYQVLLAVTRNDFQKELEYLSTFRDKQVDGIIMAASVSVAEHKQILKSLTVPVVIIGQYLAGYSCVFHDDYHATYDLTKLLLEKGRRKLGYIGAVLQDRAAGEERYRGFRDAVCDLGYAELAENFVTASFTIDSGYQKAGELLKKCEELDGMICATDSMAAGAMQYMREHNIRVPDQILLAGEGDSEIARVMEPPLITVHYSYQKSGEIAVQMLMELMENNENDVKEIKLGYRIIE